MMFSGIVDIVIFAMGHDYMAGSGWFLANGILTVLMSLFILENRWFTALGIILAVVGFLSFTHPFASIAAMALGIGFFLILQGIVSILRGCFSSRIWL